MIDPKKNASMLQCYKCYNVSPIGLRGCCRGDWAVTLRRSGGRDETFSGEFSDVSIIGKLVEKQPVVFFPTFASLT